MRLRWRKCSIAVFGFSRTAPTWLVRRMESSDSCRFHGDVGSDLFREGVLILSGSRSVTIPCLGHEEIQIM